MTKLSTLVGTAEAARICRCSSRTIQRAAKKHSIGTVICGSRCFSQKDIVALKSLVRPH